MRMFNPNKFHVCDPCICNSFIIIRNKYMLKSKNTKGETTTKTLSQCFYFLLLVVVG